ncbi:MAG: ABC transporter permease [Acidobacteriota bacterium]
MKGVEIVYDGESSHRQRWRRMWRDLKSAPPLARQWVRRGFAADHRPSLLGWLLLFLPPLGLVLWATLAQRGELIRPGELGMSFPVFVLVGVVLWQTFVEAMNLQIETLATELPTLAKLDLPPEAFILAALGRVGIHLAAKLALVALAMAILGARPGWGVLLAPLAILALVALGTAFGLLLAPFAALYRDVSRALQASITAWFFLTPIFYSVPEAGLLRALVRANPVSPLLVTARELIVQGTSAAEGWWLILALLLVVVLLPLAWFVYRLALPIVIERTGA